MRDKELIINLLLLSEHWIYEETPSSQTHVWASFLMKTWLRIRVLFLSECHIRPTSYHMKIPVTGQGLLWARTNDWPAVMSIGLFESSFLIQCFFLRCFFFKFLHVYMYLINLRWFCSQCFFKIQVYNQFLPVWMGSQKRSADILVQMEISHQVVIQLCTNKDHLKLP